jgi:hypothetical protein
VLPYFPSANLTIARFILKEGRKKGKKERRSREVKGCQRGSKEVNGGTKERRKDGQGRKEGRKVKEGRKIKEGRKDSQ